MMANKGQVAAIAAILRSGNWIPLSTLWSKDQTYKVGFIDAQTIVDVLHYAGVIRSRYVSETDDIEYQWIQQA